MINECIKKILSETPSPYLNAWAKGGEEEVATSLHFNFGMHLRNKLGLWETNLLTKYFNKLGIWHADDMSGIIITSLHRFLNHKDLKVKEQVKYYVDYWAKQEKQDK